MANYGGNTRTNYFRVTDKEYFEKDIMESVVALEDTVRFWTKEENGDTYYAFGCNDTIMGICECTHCNSCKGCEYENMEDSEECQDCECNGEYSEEKMIKELQKVIHPEDAIIIVESGNEKLRLVSSYSTIITSKGVKHINIWDQSIKEAGEMLENKEYSTECTY